MVGGYQLIEFTSRFIQTTESGRVVWNYSGIEIEDFYNAVKRAFYKQIPILATHINTATSPIGTEEPHSAIYLGWSRRLIENGDEIFIFDLGDTTGEFRDIKFTKTKIQILQS